MKNIVVVGFNTDYGFLDMEALRKEYCVTRVSVHPLLTSFLIRLNKLSNKLFELAAEFIFNIYLKNITEDAILISDDNVVSLRAHFSAATNLNRKVIIFRNTFNYQINLNRLSHVEKYSFDKDDCDKYGFKNYNQYCSGFDYIYRNKEKRNKNPVTFYFLGLDKGRRKILKLLENKLTNYTKKIDIKERPTGFKKLSNFIFKEEKYQYLNYSTHLDNILSCSVVIDIVQKGQSGLTMRAIEALAAGKKIITNNKNIINEPFYNTKNIMIIDDTVNINNVDVERFVNKDVINIDYSILEKYKVVNVFQSILE